MHSISIESQATPFTALNHPRIEALSSSDMLAVVSKLAIQ
jgi:hypothetical protein